MLKRFKIFNSLKWEVIILLPFSYHCLLEHQLCYVRSVKIHVAVNMLVLSTRHLKSMPVQDRRTNIILDHLRDHVQMFGRTKVSPGFKAKFSMRCFHAWNAWHFTWGHGLLNPNSTRGRTWLMKLPLCNTCQSNNKQHSVMKATTQSCKNNNTILSIRCDKTENLKFSHWILSSMCMMDLKEKIRLDRT